MNQIPEKRYARATVEQLRQRVSLHRAAEVRQSFVMEAWTRKARSE